MFLEVESWDATGNTFVLPRPDPQLQMSPDLAQAICREYETDGVIVTTFDASEQAPSMKIWNRRPPWNPEMCGNGIRAVALAARNWGMTDQEKFQIITDAGPKTVEILSDSQVRVDLGPPIFDPRKIPVKWPDANAMFAKIKLDKEWFDMSCLSMGNPHAVVFVNEADMRKTGKYGPLIENHPMFPNKTNVEFVHMISQSRIKVRFWERGVGKTLSCGTGAAAAMVATCFLYGAKSRLEAIVEGGKLILEWDGSEEKEAPVYLTGEARQTGTAKFNLPGG